MDLEVGLGDGGRTIVGNIVGSVVACGHEEGLREGHLVSGEMVGKACATRNKNINAKNKVLDSFPPTIFNPTAI